MAESKTTILVVDDEEHVRTLLKRILEGVGYAVVTATNGREAIEKLPTANNGLVLLDVKMPELDGFQTLSLIRKQSDILVIMVTGMGEVISVQNGLSLGADDYVTKPFSAPVLLASIEAKLRRSKKQD